jgi:hypothetical protein
VRLLYHLIMLAMALLLLYVVIVGAHYIKLLRTVFAP